MIIKTFFDKHDGKDVYLYTIDNGEIKVGVLDFGGIVNFIEVGGVNICVGYDCVDGYLNSRSYCGGTIGRVANRIAGSKFTLGGKEYKLAANEGENCLHGGVVGFDKRFFYCDAQETGHRSSDGSQVLAFSLISEDGDMGFPGRLVFHVKFIVNGKTLRIEYRAKSDKYTVFSPTCHAYFNMNGGGEVMSNILQINADGITPVDDALIPLGTVESVENTPFDFRTEKPIGRDYAKLGGKTYDHNFCLNGGFAACAKGDRSGITMKMVTDLPGVQFYVGKPAEYKGKGGGYGFCLEPQYYPNAVNVKDFASPAIKAKETVTHYIEYSFE